ncbi:MAG: 16S rRNA (cytosine(1402)-N(4))-methyltransferase [Deltaproteobacteria bacterium]|nr:16S rRNA (cytosine(1402)-N(4))-methyltransferase [Deltaproteobacteria bacterium]
MPFIPRKLPIFPITSPPLIKALKRKGLRPCHMEVNLNPRARSAIMRVAERTYNE